MPTIGQKAEKDTQLVCSRCGHMTIVNAGSVIRPCPSCMNIEFELAEPREERNYAEPADIGLTLDDLREGIHSVLRAKSGLNRMQVEAVSEAIARVIEQNNRKLQQGIEAAFRELSWGNCRTNRQRPRIAWPPK